MLPEWRQSLAEGNQLTEWRCPQCRGLMVLVGPLLEP
jgi:hypothetical protein